MHSHSDKPRYISRSVLHEISKFYRCHPLIAATMLHVEFNEKCVRGLNNKIFKYLLTMFSEIIMGTLPWQSFFLGVELSCFKERILKPKCVVADVTWNNLAFAFSHANKQNLLGTTSI